MVASVSGTIFFFYFFFIISGTGGGNAGTSECARACCGRRKTSGADPDGVVKRIEDSRLRETVERFTPGRRDPRALAIPQRCPALPELYEGSSRTPPAAETMTSSEVIP